MWNNIKDLGALVDGELLGFKPFSFLCSKMTVLREEIAKKLHLVSVLTRIHKVNR